MADIRIEALEGEEHEGRQWGYLITVDDEPSWHASTGGTGPCWNLTEVSSEPNFEPDQVHICDLDELIATLTTLRDSEAHKANAARWA